MRGGGGGGGGVGSNYLEVGGVGVGGGGRAGCIIMALGGKETGVALGGLDFFSS